MFFDSFYQTPYPYGVRPKSDMLKATSTSTPKHQNPAVNMIDAPLRSGDIDEPIVTPRVMLRFLNTRRSTVDIILFATIAPMKNDDATRIVRAF